MSDGWITGEKINYIDNENLVRDIKEILVLKKVEINEVVLKLNKKSRKQKDELSEEYMSRITMDVCKLITDRISKYNWYFRVIRKWNKIFNKKWAVQLRYSKSNRKKRGKKKEKEKKKEKYEEKRGKKGLVHYQQWRASRCEAY